MRQESVSQCANTSTVCVVCLLLSFFSSSSSSSLFFFYFFPFFLVYPLEQTTRKWIMIDGCGYLRRRKENINSSFFIMDVHTSFDSWKIQFNSLPRAGQVRSSMGMALFTGFCILLLSNGFMRVGIRACDLPFVVVSERNLKVDILIIFFFPCKFVG